MVIALIVIGALLLATMVVVATLYDRMKTAEWRVRTAEDTCSRTNRDADSLESHVDSVLNEFDNRLKAHFKSMDEWAEESNVSIRDNKAHMAEVMDRVSKSLGETAKVTTTKRTVRKKS